MNDSVSVVIDLPQSVRLSPSTENNNSNSIQVSENMDLFNAAKIPVEVDGGTF